MAKKAFIVGVNTHGLQFAENDAMLMRECLEKHGYEISVVKGSKSTIVSKFENLLDDCNRTDTVIVYFSGHALIENGELQFVLDETTNKLSGKLNINWIVKTFGSCKRINHKLVVLDCCNAGTGHANWSSDFLDRYYILTSSGRIEQSRELDKFKAGFLTYHIHQGLIHSNPEFTDAENKVRVVEFYTWLKRQAEKHNGIENSIKVSIPHLFGNAVANFDIAEIVPQGEQQQAPAAQTNAYQETPLINVKNYFLDKRILTCLLRQQVILTLLLIGIVIGGLIWLTKTRTPDNCLLFFQVMDKKNGQPLGLSAKIFYHAGHRSYFEFTDSEGYYKQVLPCAKNGFVRVRIEAQGYQMYTRSFELKNDTTDSKKVYLTALSEKPGEPESPLQDALNAGCKLFHIGALDSAEQYFDRVRQLAPDMPEPLYWKARVATERNNKVVALDYLERALQLSPQHVPSLALKIKLLVLQGGNNTELAKQIAINARGQSKVLDCWLDCLETNGIFMQMILTASELDAQCDFQQGDK